MLITKLTNPIFTPFGCALVVVAISLSPIASGQTKESQPERSAFSLNATSQQTAFAGVEFRTPDGSNNNLTDPTLGSPFTVLRRIAPSDYADGASAPAGASRVSARVASNNIFAQSGSIDNNDNLTSMVWQWGQFLDHDIDLSEAVSLANGGIPFDILVPFGDPIFDPMNTGTAVINFTRAIAVDVNGVREQENEITTWIDGSNIYGSSQAQWDLLRTGSGGLMRQTAGGLLPLDANDPNGELYIAGDARANEQLGLLAMHTLFVREHNLTARKYASRNPSLNDEQLFLMARRRVIGILQRITYEEFLPALLGPNAIPAYTGYDSTVDPRILNEFNTAAFRVGHTMLPGELLRLNNDGTVAPEGNIPLRDAFFQPTEILQNGIDSILKGLTVQPAQEIDAKVIDDVRNFLFFNVPGQPPLGFDLAALNIQRGRDHGLADFNTVRTAYGLPAYTAFSDISSDASVVAALTATYSSVDDIDVWAGMLAEDHFPGAAVGTTLRAIMIEQFTNLRDGDRFWHEIVQDPAALTHTQLSSPLSAVIMRNTGVRNVPRSAFLLNQ